MITLKSLLNFNQSEKDNEFYNGISKLVQYCLIKKNAATN